MLLPNTTTSHQLTCQVTRFSLNHWAPLATPGQCPTAYSTGFPTAYPTAYPAGYHTAYPNG